MSLVDILQQALTPITQAAAEAQLRKIEDENFPAYVVELSKLLALEGAAVQIRAFSGVLLKLALSGQSDVFQQRKTERWIKSVSIDQRQLCKQSCLKTLLSPVPDVSRAAAQAVSAIAQIEVPLQQWPEVVPQLNANAAKSDLSPDQKVASLQALGYICEVVDVDAIPPQQVNEILNTIGTAMATDTSEKLYLAATTAMLNTLEFANQNMKNQAERNMILSMIVQATKSKYETVRTKGYECIVRTASNYYEYLSEYMTGLYESTFNAVQNDSEPVAMQALEFWTSLAEEELYLSEDQGSTTSSGPKSANYIPRVGKQLCELLLNKCLIKQEELQDEETRNLATAGAMCLGYLSQCLKNDILPLVLPFVEQNIHNEDWHRREAAVLSFGAMLDGPNPEVIRGPLLAAFETVLSKMLKTYESNVMVRDTAAWAIAIVCNEHINMLDPAKHLEPLVKSLMQGLDDDARVARNAAFAIHNLARAFSAVADQNTNKLSPLFQHFITKLLTVTTRDDRTEWELEQNAYEAMNSLVENAARDMHPLILQLLEEVIKRLEIAINSSPNATDEKEEKDHLQMYLCGNVQVMVMKLQSEILPIQQGNQPNMIIADKIMELMIKLLRTQHASCHSDCFMVIQAVANAVESSFERYLPHVMELVVIGLNNKDEYQVCQNAVGTIGDICRAVETAVDPYCDKIVQILHENLKDEHLNRDVKPPTLAVFGDIALAIGPKFGRFLAECMATVFAAAQTQVDKEDEDMVEYLNILRENILEACTGIIQGMNGDVERGIPSNKDALNPYCDAIMQFVGMIASEIAAGGDEVGLSVCKAAVALLGDLASVIGAPTKAKIKGAKDFVLPLYNQCLTSGDQSAKEIAQWSAQVIGLS